MIQLGQVVKCDAIMESGGIKKEEGEGRTGNKFPWPHHTLPLFLPSVYFSPTLSSYLNALKRLNITLDLDARLVNKAYLSNSCLVNANAYVL